MLPGNAPIVHRFFVDTDGFQSYAGRQSWQGWGVDGDPDGSSARSHLRLFLHGGDVLELDLSRGMDCTGWGRSVRLALGLTLFRKAGPRDRRSLPIGGGHFEADLVTWADGDCRLTLQALDKKRMHGVLSLGPFLRLRFAGSLAI